MATDLHPLRAVNAAMTETETVAAGNVRGSITAIADTKAHIVELELANERDDDPGIVGDLKYYRQHLKNLETNLPWWATRGITADQLDVKVFPEPKWIVPGVIPEGLTLLAGKPKMGKSWLLLGLGVAIASGGYTLGSKDHPAVPGRVLYLALEDSERRMQNRVRMVCGDEPKPADLHVYTLGDWRRLDDGGLDDLESYVTHHQDVTLVMVDTLQKVRPKSNGRQNAYESDYDGLAKLHTFATNTGVSCIVAHHMNKLEPTDDWTDAVSGTTGLTAAADTVTGLFRSRGEATAELRITGRDVPEADLAINHDKPTGQWLLLGDAETYRLTKNRREIVEAIGEDEWVAPHEVATRIGKSRETVKQTMRRMANDGELDNTGGKYRRA